jgi:hypothetical protein
VYPEVRDFITRHNRPEEDEETPAAKRPARKAASRAAR